MKKRGHSTVAPCEMLRTLLRKKGTTKSDAHASIGWKQIEHIGRRRKKQPEKQRCDAKNKVPAKHCNKSTSKYSFYHRKNMPLGWAATSCEYVFCHPVYRFRYRHGRASRGHTRKNANAGCMTCGHLLRFFVFSQPSFYGTVLFFLSSHRDRVRSSHILSASTFDKPKFVHNLHPHSTHLYSLVLVGFRGRKIRPGYELTIYQ